MAKAARKSVVKKTTASPTTGKATKNKPVAVAKTKAVATKAMTKKAAVKKATVKTVAKKKIANKEVAAKPGVTAAKNPSGESTKALREKPAASAKMPTPNNKKAVNKKQVTTKPVEETKEKPAPSKTAAPRKPAKNRKPTAADRAADAVAALVANNSKSTNTRAPAAVSVQAIAAKPSTAPAAPVVRTRSVNLDEVKLPEGYAPTASEEYMSPLQLLYFREKLRSWRDELITESQETLDHLRSEIRDVGDEAERASRESDNILELRTRDRYRKLIKKIHDAIKRVDDGSYGYCEETGEEIGLGRLGARPIATLTVDAQERREMFQRQFRDDR
jgi:DnaK suppressor protein